MPDDDYRDSLRRPWGRMSYLHSGGGRPVLFLHSAGRSALDFPPLFRRLASARHCLAPDFCGHGQSELPAQTVTVSTLAQDLCALIGELYLGRCDLVGHGTGGIVALEVLRRQPEIVDRVVLLDTFLPESRHYDLFGEDLIPDYDRPKLQQFRNTLARWPVAVWTDFLITARAYSERELLTQSMKELLFLYADRRRTHLPARHHLGLPERPNLLLHWLEAAGHFFPLEEPEETSRLLRRYLIDESTDFSAAGPDDRRPDGTLPPASLDELMFR